MADLLIIVISEAPIKQKTIYILRSVARAFLILKKSQGNLFILPNKIALCTNMRM